MGDQAMNRADNYLGLVSIAAWSILLWLILRDEHRARYGSAGWRYSFRVARWNVLVSRVWSAE